MECNDPDQRAEDVTEDSVDKKVQSNETPHTHSQTDDPSIEPSGAGHAPPLRVRTKQHTTPRLQSASVYTKPLPQTEFLNSLKQRERELNRAIREKYYSSDDNESGGKHHENPLEHEMEEDPTRPSTAGNASSSAEQNKQQRGRPPKGNTHPPHISLRDVMESFPTTAVKDPFCPKPPIHASPIRLEASVRTVKRLFFPSVTNSNGSRMISSAGVHGHGKNTEEEETRSPRNRPATADVPLPAVCESGNNNVMKSQQMDSTKVESGSSSSPLMNCSTDSDGDSEEFLGKEVMEELLEHLHKDAMTAMHNDQHLHQRDNASTGVEGGEPHRSSAERNRHRHVSQLALADMQRMLRFLPKGYREPEVVIAETSLKHPNDPVTGRPRPKRHFRLGLLHDPARDVDPALAAEAVKDRGLPTKLSVSSTDPSVLALVDAIIESAPGLEVVELGSMDDRYEMVLRNVYTALSRNISVGVVTGNFPKAADNAFKRTIHANTERRERRLVQLAARERELKIEAMEKQILVERQEKKKLQFEQMRQRARLSDRHTRSYREVLREESEAWIALCAEEGTLLEEVREKERLRFEWWTRSVQELEAAMHLARQHDAREEHDIRETIRLDEVNRRLAALVELRRQQKQQDSDRHAVFAEQFACRKRIHQEEKQLRRKMESGLLEHLRKFLEERAREERHRREEEANRLMEEHRLAERRRKIEQNQEILLVNECEKRKAYEAESWKLYEAFKRKHFEGIVVAKNQQRVREIREKRHAAFAAADSSIPTVHFRMTPQTMSTAAAPSTVSSPANTLTYKVNNVGDLLVLNTGAVLGVHFDTDASALTYKQRITKCEPQGGVISCRIHRSDVGALLSGKEGVTLYIPTAEQRDPNVAIEGYVPREQGDVVLSVDSKRDLEHKENPLGSPASPGQSPLGTESRKDDGVSAAAAQRRRTNAKASTLNPSPNSRPLEEIEAEAKLRELCGDNRVCGILRVRDEGEHERLLSKKRKSGLTGSGTTRSVGESTPDSHQTSVSDEFAAFRQEMQLTIMEQLESESDSEDSSCGSSVRGGGTRKPLKRGYGSMKILEPTGPPKKPKRRVISWNGEDVGILELGYAGAPPEASHMSPYYLNSAIRKVRSRQSIIMKSVARRRGTVDCAESTSPFESSISPTLPATNAKQQHSNKSMFASPNMIYGSNVFGSTRNVVGAASLDDSEGGVEVFRLHIYPNASRHAVSDILAHLCYFNSSGIDDVENPLNDLVSKETLKITTTLSIAYRKTCLPRQAASSAFAAAAESPPIPSAFVTQSTPVMNDIVLCPSVATDVSEPSSPTTMRIDVSSLCWSTRATNSYVRLQLPLFACQSPKEPVYFLEDQAPMPLCKMNQFIWSLPALPAAPTPLSDQSVSSLQSQSPLGSPRRGDTLHHRPSSNAAVNCVVGNMVVIRDHSDDTLDAIEVLVGKSAITNFSMQLIILDQSRGDVFVMRDENGIVLGPERELSYTPSEADLPSQFPPGRRLAARLDDALKKDVGVEKKKVVRDLLYYEELVGFVEGFMLTPKEFVTYSDRFNAECPSDGSTERSGESLALMRTAMRRDFLGPVRISLLSNRFCTLEMLRDLTLSVAYANLNKDPDHVRRFVDVCLTDRGRKNCAVARSEITVVPVDDITEIKLNQPSWGYSVYRAPVDVRGDLQQYVPKDTPCYIFPNAQAIDPDSMYFEGGWLEVEIVEGAKDGDVLYFLQDERLFIDNPQEWSFDVVREANHEYARRQCAASWSPVTHEKQVSPQQPTATPTTHSQVPPPHGDGSMSPSQQTTAVLNSNNRRISFSNEFFQGPQPESSLQTTALNTPQVHPLNHPAGGSGDEEAPVIRITMGSFTDDEDEPSSEVILTAGLALEEVPPTLSRREMSRGRASGGSISTGTTPAQTALDPRTNPLTTAGQGLLSATLRAGVGHDASGTPSTASDLYERQGGPAGGAGITYASPLLRIEFKTISLAGLQYLLRHIAFKSVAATDKSPKFFGARKIEIRTIIGDPTIPKFRKYDPFVPIVHSGCIKVCEPLLKPVMHSMTYKEGQGTMGLALGLVEPGTDGYRCFNRGYLSATIVKGCTPDDRVVVRAVDPSQFEYGLSMLDVDPTPIFQPKRSVSMHTMKRQPSMARPTSSSSSSANLTPGTYTPGAGGVGPDGEVNPNCPPPPQHIYQQWVKAIVSGKHKFQQWKCCELYNNERAMVGFLTSTYAELFVGLRESDKVRKFGKTVGGGVTVAPPVSMTAPPAKRKIGGNPNFKSSQAVLATMAEKESRAIPVTLPEGSTPIRHVDVASLIKLISFENRSSNPVDLKKVILITLSDESTVTHLPIEINVQPVDDVTEIRKTFSGPLMFRHGFEGSYVPLFEHCSLYDPDTEYFNGGHLMVSMTHAPSEGDGIRLLSLDEQRAHRENVHKDPFAKYRGKIKSGDAGSSKPSGSSSSTGTAKATTATVGKAVILPSGGATAVVAPEGGTNATPLKSEALHSSTTEKTTDPNEPHEFYLDTKRKVIYWFDRHAKPQPSAASYAPEGSIVAGLGCGSLAPDFQRFIESGAFSAISPRNNPNGNFNHDSGSRTSNVTTMRLGDEGAFRRIGTYSINTEIKKKGPSSVSRKSVRQGSMMSKSEMLPSHSIAGDSSLATNPDGTVVVPDIAVTGDNAAGFMDNRPSLALDIGSSFMLDQSFGSTNLRMQLQQLNTQVEASAANSAPNTFHLHIKIDELVNEDDVDEDDPVERAAPVTIGMLQALMRNVAFYNTSPPTKVKSGPRSFLLRVGPPGGGEEGKTKVICHVNSSLIGWMDNAPPPALFRPRMSVIYPFQRFLFLNDLIIKAGFLLLEVCEGFEPTEDIVKLNEIGRAFVLKNGKILLQPKDQLIGTFQTLELDGVPYGFLVGFDNNCRVSGSILQTLCRSFSYSNSTRHTGKRRLRITMCDGTYYESSTTEIPLTVDQDEDTIPVRFGSSAGSVVYMDGMPAVHIVPDIHVTLKGVHHGRVLVPPAVLEIETQAGGHLAMHSSGDVEIAENGQFKVRGKDAGRVIQSVLGGESSAEGPAPRQPSSMNSRKSFSRSSFVGRMHREGSVIGPQQSGTLTVANSSASATVLTSPKSAGPARLSPRSPAPDSLTGTLQPHQVRIEFSSMPMLNLQAVLRSIVFSHAQVARELSRASVCEDGSNAFPDNGGSGGHGAGAFNRTGSFAFKAAAMANRRNLVSFGSFSAATLHGATSSPNTTSTTTIASNASVTLPAAAAAATTTTTAASASSSPPATFTVSMQLSGVTNELGKVSYLPVLNVQSVVRVCDFPTMFMLPSESTQAAMGEVFAATQVKFAPRVIHLSWRAILEPVHADSDAVEVEKRNAAAQAFAAGIQLTVGSRCGVMISSNGETISYGRDTIGTIVSTASPNSATLNTKEPPLTFSPTHRGASSSGSENDPNKGTGPDMELDAAVTDKHDLDDLLEEDESFSPHGGNNSLFSPPLGETSGFKGPPQKLSISINQARRVNADVVGRLMRSLVTYPLLQHPVAFTITFEASEECTTTNTVVVSPYAAAGRRQSRSSFTFGPRPPGNGRKGSRGGLIAVGAAERIGRQQRKKA